MSIGLALAILIGWCVYDELRFGDLARARQVYITSDPAAIPEVEKVARTFTLNHSTMWTPAEGTGGREEIVFRDHTSLI